MPMHMAMALLASAGEKGDPLGRNHLSDGLSHPIDALLKCQSVFQGKVPGRLFKIGVWSDERIASTRWIRIQEDHRCLILIPERMVPGWIASQHFAADNRIRDRCS